MGSTVLIVDDDEQVARSIARAIRTEHEPRVAHSAAEAERMMRGAVRWDAFIFDVGLPSKVADGGEVSGLDLAELARLLHPGIPTVLLTGRVTPARVNRALRLGASLLCKPVSRRLLKLFLAPAACSSGPTALLTCAQRHPGRWSDAAMAAATAMVTGCTELAPADWADILDRIDRDLALALPVCALGCRCGTSVH